MNQMGLTRSVFVPTGFGTVTGSVRRSKGRKTRRNKYRDPVSVTNPVRLNQPRLPRYLKYRERIGHHLRSFPTRCRRRPVS